MSYSKSYRREVHYSGSESYSHSYPPSETGGTVSGTVYYSGSVPVNIELYVDTNPFDDSVKDCSRSVGNLNGAVVAMNSAQVAAITHSAHKVSDHITSGFFKMIKFDLDQNMAALFAQFKAVFELMVSKSDTLRKQQVIMQDDYARVSDRYNKVFQNLDDELEKRVVALDKNVVQISKRVQSEQLYNDVSKKVTQLLLSVNEDEIVQQQLIVARAKEQVLRVIENLAGNVIQESVYTKKIDSIIREESNISVDSIYIPVIFSEMSGLNHNDGVCYACYSNSASNDAREKINETAKNYFISDISRVTQNNEYEMKLIDEAFTVIAEKAFQNLRDEKSIRVFNVLKKLKEA